MRRDEFQIIDTYVNLILEKIEKELDEYEDFDSMDRQVIKVVKCIIDRYKIPLDNS